MPHVSRAKSLESLGDVVKARTARHMAQKAAQGGISGGISKGVDVAADFHWLSQLPGTHSRHKDTCRSKLFSCW